MGNLLGSPVTDKETHRGVTKDEELKFGLSSMQGWRVHMEDAHIAEGELYALDLDIINNTNTKIPLPGHALFAVYDGHGGTFAAIYSGANFLRILSKQPKFVQYAKMCAASASASASTTTATTGPANNSTANNSTTVPTRAAKMQVLEQALKQAFVETDYEIGLAVRGKSHADANSPYHDHDDPAAGVSVVATDDDDTNSNNNSTNNRPPPAMAGAAMKAASDHLSAIEDEGDSGTTSCVVMITPDSIVCANAGDSRAVFARRPQEVAASTITTGDNSNSNNVNVNVNVNVGKSIPLSFDHKPDDEEEERRVRNAGGYVAGGRVEGDLAVSRGLGDFRFKQMAVVLNNTQLYPEEESNSNTNNAATDMATDDEGDDDENSNSNNSNANNSRVPMIFPPGDQKVSPVPDVIVHTRNAERDEYVVVACDGIWDVVSNQQCISELDEIMYAEGERDLGLVSEEILDTCLRYGSKDNMTAIVIQLPGCEKSYADAAAKNSSSSSSNSGSGSTTSEQQQQQQPKQRKIMTTTTTTSATSGTTTTTMMQQEGVAGRRRKREEVMSATMAAQHEDYEDEADGGYIDNNDSGNGRSPE